LVTGASPGGEFVEIVELRDHPWFVAVQCHPEFKSKPTWAHPLFRGLVEASLKRREGKKTESAKSRASTPVSKAAVV
jgi:CTP synthase